MKLRIGLAVSCEHCCIVISVKRAYGSTDHFPDISCPQCGRRDKIEFIEEFTL